MERIDFSKQTPAQIVRTFKCRQNSRMIQNLMLSLGTICILGLLLAGRLGFAKGVFLILLCVIWIHRNQYEHSDNLGQWINILQQDCDPVKFLEVIERFEQERKYQNAQKTIMLCKALAYYYLDEMEASFSTIEDVCENHDDLLVRIIRYKIKIAYFKKNGDINRLNEMRMEILKENELCINHDERQVFKEMLAIIDAALLDFIGRYDASKQLLLEELTKSQNEIDKVQWTYELANTCYKMGDYRQANIMVRYVIEHGNTLHCVAAAKEIQKKLGNEICGGMNA